MYLTSLDIRSIELCIYALVVAIGKGYLATATVAIRQRDIYQLVGRCRKCKVGRKRVGHTLCSCRCRCNCRSRAIDLKHATQLLLRSNCDTFEHGCIILSTQSKAQNTCKMLERHGVTLLDVATHRCSTKVERACYIVLFSREIDLWTISRCCRSVGVGYQERGYRSSTHLKCCSACIA